MYTLEHIHRFQMWISSYLISVSNLNSLYSTLAGNRSLKWPKGSDFLNKQGLKDDIKLTGGQIME